MRGVHQSPELVDAMSIIVGRQRGAVLQLEATDAVDADLTRDARADGGESNHALRFIEHVSQSIAVFDNRTKIIVTGCSRFLSNRC